MTSHPCQVLSPSQNVWTYWNNIPKKGLFCFVFCPDTNHLALNFKPAFSIRFKGLYCRNSSMYWFLQNKPLLYSCLHAKICVWLAKLKNYVMNPNICSHSSVVWPVANCYFHLWCSNLDKSCSFNMKSYLFLGEITEVPGRFSACFPRTKAALCLRAVHAVKRFQ